jgi:acetyl esterase/lipase
MHPLPNGANLHWVGPQPAAGCNVLLYFHGGGYNVAIAPWCVSFALKCASNANAALALLEYTLAPAGHYPTQLHQAIEALRQILAITSPSHITIGGDSAGGHLSTSLLSHLMHPVQATEPITLSEKLRGIFLIAPFLSFNYNKESYTYNASKDFLQLKDIKEFNGNFKPPGLSDTEAMKDPGLSPLDSPIGWWKDCPVERILLTAGAWEVFLDDVVEFFERLKEETGPGTKVDLVVGRKEVHCACIVDGAFGLQEGDTAMAISSWISDGIVTTGH